MGVDGNGFCAACNRSGKVAPRFNIRCRFVDFESSGWMTTFHEGAHRILGLTAEEAQALERQDGGRDALEKRIRESYFDRPVQVTVRAKLDTWNGEVKSNVSCVDALPVRL